MMRVAHRKIITTMNAIILKEKGIMSTLEERSAQRRQRMETNRASSPEEAEVWDLDFWQDAGPQARLSALVAIREEVALVQTAKTSIEEERD